MEAVLDISLRGLVNLLPVSSSCFSFFSSVFLFEVSAVPRDLCLTLSLGLARAELAVEASD